MEKCQLDYFISTQININVTASIPHTEFDCSSTLIYFPEQVNKMHSYGFEIKLNYFTSMVIRLVTGTTIIYSAYMITQIKINNILSDFGNKAGQCVNKCTSEETSNDVDFYQHINLLQRWIV